MFHEVWEFERFQTAKVTFKVIQGHWQLCHLIGHMWFSISVPLQLCLYLAPLTTLSLGSQNLRRSRDTSHIPFGVIYHACASSPMYESAHKIWSTSLHWFDSKDMIGPKFKKSGHAHRGVFCYWKPSTCYILRACTVWRLLFQSFQSYDYGCQNWQTWVTWPWHASLGVVCHP